MTIDTVRQICRAFQGITEDIKWGNDLVFSAGGKMFAVVCLEPPHTVAFKCAPDTFVELIERDGVIPAPYLARAQWVQEVEIGQALERRELEQLLRRAYDLVVAKLPKSRQPTPTRRPASRRPAGRSTANPKRRSGEPASGARSSRRGPAASRRRRG